MASDIFASFPNGLLPKEDKDKYSYGKKVFKAILGSTKVNREIFKEELLTNRLYADGNQPIKQYLDQLEIDGKNMYTNISYKPRPIAKNFKNVVVNGYVMREEYPLVTATSKHIKERKEKKKSDAEFRMEYGEVLNQISEQAGVPLTSPDEYTPENKEDLDLYFSLNDREKEELLMQDIISFALRDNDIEDLKNQFLSDQFIAQLAGYYNYIDDNGRLCVEYIQPEDAILDNSRREDFKDSEFSGRYLRLTISQVRRRFKLTPDQEKEVYESAKFYVGQYGNPSNICDWNNDYRNTGGERPYDNYTVLLGHVWWRTSKVLTYVEGKDRYGRKIFDVTPKKQVTTDRKRIGHKYPETAYEGFFLASNCMCLEWGEQKNILRKGEDKQELLCPFIYRMPDNVGRMLPHSLMNMMIDSIQVMDVSILKIKQVIAKMTPDDYVIDVDGLMEMDLGNGTLQPLDIVTIHQQTGRLYYRGTSEDGKTIQPPIRATANPVDTKLQALINLYNIELQNIRTYLGVNEFRDGTANTPRVSSNFMQAQQEASNTSTWFIYNAYIKATEELIRQIGIRIWDSLNYGDVNKGYLKYLGKENIEFIQSRKDITSSSYDIDFKLGMTQQDKANLVQYINTALANQQIEIGDVFTIERIKDPRIAEQMLTFLSNKRRKERQEESLMASQMQAQSAAQAGKAVEEAKQQSIKLQIQAEQEKEKAKGDNAQTEVLLKGAMDILVTSFTNGTEIPDAYKPLIDLALENASSKTTLSLYVSEKEQEQIAMQEQQEQMAQELQMAVESGEISEEEAMMMAQENGLM